MNIRFLDPGKEKRDLLRMKGLGNGGNRQLRPLWQGFFCQGSEGESESCVALIHWSQAKFADRDLDRALGWRPSVKRGRIGQVAELRRVAEFNGISNYWNFSMLDSECLEAGTSNLAEFWKKKYGVDLLWIVWRVLYSSGVDVGELKRLGWEPLCEEKAGRSLGVNEQGGLWIKEMVPNAKKILCTPSKTRPVRRKSSLVYISQWVASLKPKDLIELRKTISKGFIDTRPKKGRHYGMGPMIAFLWLAEKSGQQAAARAGYWLEGLDAPSQRALGFSKKDSHGRPMLPSRKVIGDFLDMMITNNWNVGKDGKDANFKIINARFEEWLKKRVVPVPRRWIW